MSNSPIEVRLLEPVTSGVMCNGGMSVSRTGGSGVVSVSALGTTVAPGGNTVSVSTTLVLTTTSLTAARLHVVLSVSMLLG